MKASNFHERGGGASPSPRRPSSFAVRRFWLAAALAAFFPTSAASSAQEPPRPAFPFYALDDSNVDERGARNAASASAYASKAIGPNVDAFQAISPAPNRPTLQIEDVAEFSAVAEVGATEIEADWADEENEASVVEAEENAVEESETNVAAVVDECFFALDPYSSLFIEYPPTAEWTNAALLRVEEILSLLATEPTRASFAIKEFRAEIAASESLKEAIVEADSSRGAVSEFGAVDAKDGERTALSLETRYSLEQRLELFESFRCALDRRAFVWGRVAEVFAAKTRGELVAPEEISLSELAQIRRATVAARNFFGDSQVGQNWRTSFEIDLLLTDLDRTLELASPRFVPVGAALDDAAREAVDVERTRRTNFLRDRLNSVCYKIEKTPMTPEQRRVFDRAPLNAWVAAVAPYSCDRADALALLLDFEKYERDGGGEIGRTLQRNARRMTTSRSEVCRRFGKAFDVVYDNPNAKAYVSEALINRLLPIRDPEFSVVQETVLNNPVAGRRRSDVQVGIELIPDPSRLLMNLNVSGRVVASTSSNVFPATLYNQSYATYFGKKTLEWRDDGFAYSPAVVSAESVNKLSGVQTDVDFIPLVGDLTREVARSQYQAKQGAIRSEMKTKVAREARARIDAEANERFDAVNARMRANFFADLERLGLSLKTQRSKTTDEWLLASLRLGTDFSLGCQTTEPPTLPGAFADVKLHESAVNAALERLELGGKTLTPEETIAYLAEKLEKPGLAAVEIEESELVVSFAEIDPIVVRFFEDRVELRLRFAALTLGDETWENVDVSVSYRPTVADDGTTVFERDGVVELVGPGGMRAQLALRSIFSKVFPASRAFDMRPKFFDSDERFAGLALGLARVSRGWFAISVVCLR
ncbi:MAG: hypothetical protein IKU86_13485 [Thermoguttaceae bacterium]|nr:hypothetical protein [Thermoguttaceae bacterium]